MGKFFSCFLVIFLSVLLISCGSNVKTITITPVGNEMKYEVSEFEVNAGETVKLVMNNTATAKMMKHNVVILNDKNAVDRVGRAALTAPDYLPKDDAIIVATPMAGAGETTEVEFVAPQKVGEYVYICTFPGHYMVMKGVMRVL